MPARTLYGIDIEVALGIGRQADWGVWDSGTWDVDVWGDPDTALGDWVDVTCQVIDGLQLSARARTQADGVVTRWEAATAVFTLLGDDWDPWAGPYAGPGRTPGPGPGAVAGLERRSANGSTRSKGRSTMKAGNGNRPRPAGMGTAAVVATDYTSDLTSWDPPDQAPVGDGDTAAQRVGRILDLVDWPAERRAVTPGGATLQPTELGDEAWAMLLDVADADLGLLWVRRDGALAYIPQGRVAVGVGTRRPARRLPRRTRRHSSGRHGPRPTPGRPQRRVDIP